MFDQCGQQGFQGGPTSVALRASLRNAQSKAMSLAMQEADVWQPLMVPALSSEQPCPSQREDTGHTREYSVFCQVQP